MKKFFKSGLLALALIAGASGAVVTKVHAAAKLVDPTYNWNVGQPDQDLGRTIVQAKSDFGCPNDNTGCAHGVLAAGQSGNPTADISEL